jgi:hypothetical protein
MDNLTQIMATLIAIVGSTALWQFLSTWIKTRAERKKDDMANDDGNLYRNDLKDRVSNLEKLLLKSQGEKDELNEKVLRLTAQVSELKVKVEFLEKENERLKMK